MHVSGTASLSPGGNPVIVGPATLLGALDLLHGPDGDVLQPGLPGVGRRLPSTKEQSQSLHLGL